MKTKAYSYVRFSTGDQIKGDSQRRQTEAAEAWCRKNGVTLVTQYSDLGVSAFRGKNAETGSLGRFLAMVRSGRIEAGSYLVVESLDRVSRNSIMEAFDVFRDIIKAGIKLVTLSDNQIYDKESINNNWTSLIISLTVMSRAHEESKMKSQRLAAAWSAKRSQVSQKKLTSRCVAWLRMTPDGKRFEVIPDKANTVRRIFEMAAQGKGANSITKALRTEKVKPIGRKPVWFTSYVKKILDNRAVIGEFTPAVSRNGKREFLDAIPDYYPAIVSKELFATVQQLRRARPSYVGRSTFNVFSKLAFDMASGAPMLYVNKNRKRGWHYLVPRTALMQEVAYCSWPYDDFLESFIGVCQHAALQKPPQPKGQVSGKLNLAKMELSDVESQISRLIDVLSRGHSTAIETKLRELEAEKTRLQSNIDSFQIETSAKPIEVSKVDWQDSAALRENLRATVKRIGVDAQKRSFICEFFDGRICDFKTNGDRVTITNRKASK